MRIKPITRGYSKAFAKVELAKGRAIGAFYNPSSGYSKIFSVKIARDATFRVSVGSSGHSVKFSAIDAKARGRLEWMGVSYAHESGLDELKRDLRHYTYTATEKQVVFEAYRKERTRLIATS